VRNGVAATSAEVVLVHDAARPLASPALADAVALAAAEHGAAIPVLAVVDSLKRVNGKLVTQTVDRTGLFRSQTPQGARRDLLVDALAAAPELRFTDEAALLEATGVTVVTVSGEATNIKLTEPGDLELARALVRGSEERRIGFGQDSHGFGPDDGLWLGGIFVELSPRLYGHSDGDVVLHALATAVLSACGLGDIGRLFPAGARETKGIASAELLAEATRQAAAAGWTLQSAQVSLVGARPRLGAGLIDGMRARMAELLDLPNDAVSLTASTGNLSGPEGAGRVISATALVSAHRR
jgi:2-C-methyl-D-erythritol 4-phosphate cytidylyltransferase/2-C-methyl-D-erythritol 2,4-cyclodiphosphate synthase